MASTSETGHGKNVANFDKLVLAIVSFGPRYNPSKSLLRISDCQTASANAKLLMENLNRAKATYAQARGQRESIYAGIKKFSTRIINAVAASDANPATLDAARSLNKKIQGTRIGKKPETAPAPADGDPSTGENTPKTRSTSQQSFDMVLDNFQKLAALLSMDAGYKPNEAELAPTGLNTVITDLVNANTDANQAEIELDKLVMERNRVLYTNPDSLLERYRGIKQYVKSVFGAKSSEFAGLNDFPFRSARA